jgi:hypothetical protein
MESHLAELHENHYYPFEITEYDYDNKLGTFFLSQINTNLIVWDIKKGNLLCIDKHGIIQHAYSG